VPIALALACGGGAKRTDDMMHDIRAFNEGLRWDKLPQSAIRIPPAERDAFLDEREQLQDELRIDDFDITRLKTEGKLKERANVQIKWVWHMDREGIVKTTTSQQRWKRFGARWLMLRESYVRGDEMPGLAEAEDRADDDDEVENAEEMQDDASTDSKPQARMRSEAWHEVAAALRTETKTHRIAE